MLQLKEANLADREKEYLFTRDIPAEENSYINEWHGIGRDDYVPVALKAMQESSRGQNLPEGYVPETFLYLWRGEDIVGQFRIRHHLTDALRMGAGHVGYYIHPEYRGMGYATRGLRLALEWCRDIVPEEEIHLRVDKDNPASLRVMQKCGGHIHAEDENKYYVRISKGQK